MPDELLASLDAPPHAGDSIDVYEGEWNNEWIVIDPMPFDPFHVLAAPYGFEDDKNFHEVVDWQRVDSWPPPGNTEGE